MVLSTDFYVYEFSFGKADAGPTAFTIRFINREG